MPINNIPGILPWKSRRIFNFSLVTFITVLMLSISFLAYSFPPMWLKIFSALPYCNFVASQRGLSGMKNIRIKKSPEGTTSAQNIQRQPICPFHVSRMFSPGTTGSAINQLTNWAARIPNTIVNWLIDTNFPRTWLGDTSAIYMGDKLAAMPMPIPPNMR